MPLPTLIRPALNLAKSRVFEAARWNGYVPRSDDIVIATYSKCGTTWTQHIVSMLVFKDAEPRAVFDVSPWPDFRFMLPPGAVWPIAEAQTHRRFFKTHLSLDSLPLYTDVKYIHVARDGRDAALSLHNHLANFSSRALEIADKISLSDPDYADPFPRTTHDPREFFHQWLQFDQAGNNNNLEFFSLERTYWAERKRSNVLLVHYADMKKDLEAEIRRIAAFLEIDISESLWPKIVEAAGFDAMKRNGDKIMPVAAMLWEGGSSTFIHKGTNGRWRDLFAPDDLAAYEAKVKREFSPALAQWVESGRHFAGDPRLAD